MRSGHKDVGGLGFGLAAGALAAAAPTGRVYGHANIKRMLQKHGRSRQVGYSIAQGPHDNAREIARRLRQAERDRENRLARAKKALAPYGVPRGIVVRLDDDANAEHGLSRRGRWVPLT